MNVLLTSVGIRNILIAYFKRELGRSGKVFAADCDEGAPALYEADAAFVIPRVSDGRYLRRIAEICNENSIDVVLSLIDTELRVLARAKREFEKNGILCVVSDEDVVYTCQDKYKMHTFFLDHGFLAHSVFVDVAEVQSALDKGELGFPLVVKGRNASGSVGMRIADSWEELKLITRGSKEDLVIEEFLKGQEYGIDVYIDLITKKVVSVVPKRKIRMRAGETDKAVSVKNQALIELSMRLVEELGIVGPCDIDCIDTGGGLYVIDVNLRFGGGYPLSHECGANFVQMIVQNARGQKNPNRIGDYTRNRYMFKYYDICIKDRGEIESMSFRYR